MLYDLPDDYFNSYIQKVRAVTLADVQRVANRYLDPAKMAILVVGDRKVIEPGLRSLEAVGTTDYVRRHGRETCGGAQRRRGRLSAITGHGQHRCARVAAGTGGTFVTSQVRRWACPRSSLITSVNSIISNLVEAYYFFSGFKLGEEERGQAHLPYLRADDRSFSIRRYSCAWVLRS